LLGGTSVLSATDMVPPLPLHVSFWQSPAACCAAGSAVPAVVYEKPQTPFVHVRCPQNESVPEQLAAVVQPTQCPVLSHVPALHTAPDPAGVNVGVMPTQESVVQSFPSFGPSVASAIVVIAPVPLQTAFLQSPAVCAATAVPAIVNVCPHCPEALHVRFWHSSSGGSCVQSLGATHCTHSPFIEQTWPPLSLHGMPTLPGIFKGTPATHLPTLHAVLVVGISVSSLSFVIPPDPSQISVLQSPTTWSAAGSTVPITTAIVPHCPPMQTGVSHGPFAAGQSVIELQ
jgi:hypothetical protein